MQTLQIKSNDNAYEIIIGAFDPGREPSVHGHRLDLDEILHGISRRHVGTSFRTEGEAEGALSAAYLARLAGIRA